MHTYVINLDRRPDNIPFVQQECAKMGFQFQRWPAVDGKTLDIDDAVFQQPINRINRYTRGCHALTLTTIAILEDAIKHDHEQILILEDDVMFVPEAKMLLELATQELPQGWELFSLGCYHFKKPSVYNHVLVKVNGFWYVHAYMVHRRAYHVYLEAIKNSFRPVDLTYGMHMTKRGHVYAINPNIAFQRRSDSDITGLKNFETLIPANPFDCKEIIPVEELLQIDPSFDLSQILNTLPY